MAKQMKATKPFVTVVPEGGKLPPQAIDMEEAVLGAIMLEKGAVIAILDLLRSDCFYKEAHKKIFEVIVELNTKEYPVDLFTVTEALRAKGELESVGGSTYLAQLTSKVVSAANVDFHGRIVAQKYIQRELIRVSTEILSRAYDDTNDITDLLDFSENSLFQIAEGNIKREVSPISAVVKDAIHEIEEAGKNKDSLVGVPSGFTGLDKLTSGWQRSELIIVAARPSMGKTAFALSMARNIAIDHGKSVAIFSLEMSAVQLANRLIVSETELASDKIRNGRLSESEWKQLDAKIKDLVKAPIYIDDTPGISTFELRAKCRRLMAQHKLDIVMVDYLQLMTGPENAGSREQEVSTISRMLKSIAKELNVPIIALSQLNRSVELRSQGNRRPMLSDLRESGAIEQDADMVLFIHRQEKMGIPTFEDGSSTKGIAEIILAKNRNGRVDDVRVRFREERALFVDLNDADYGETSGFVESVKMESKMNNDEFLPSGNRNAEFKYAYKSNEEPPFA